jgi:dipeptidyl aminopeptidase/acylaminoacyl peptidase
VLASGRNVAVLTAAANRPLSVAVVPANGGSPRVIYPVLTSEFPAAAHVTPTAVTLKAEDGFEFYNQLFLPKDIRPGEKRPAIVFVHGGPPRQMLLGYHYMDFYHIAYAVNQWLATRGYIVLSVNYRLGIGYGRSFQRAPDTGARGNAEYRDVLAAGKYLQSRSDVDPDRVGIWGLSYGGVLTAQALARNSDVFAAGVDMAGVHLWGSSLNPEDMSYQSSAISAVDGWKSPVLIWHGDDDRNVYVVISLAIAGRTPGKSLAGLRVVSKDGSVLSVRRAVGRTLAFPLSVIFFGIGFLGIIFQREHKALHDYLAKTAVVYDWGTRTAELPGPLSAYIARKAGEEYVRNG